MKLVKGIVIGSAITAAAYMMCQEGMINKKRMMKRGKQLAKKLGAF